ncbi:ATPase family AAA domain-containing protein [Paramyrothecium foliicola]|nr:ATPase family AAA domain-containing protein [Paramyrothecium foliicola]
MNTHLPQDPSPKMEFSAQSPPFDLRMPAPTRAKIASDDKSGRDLPYTLTTGESEIIIRNEIQPLNDSPGEAPAGKRHHDGTKNIPERLTKRRLVPSVRNGMTDPDRPSVAINGNASGSMDNKEIDRRIFELKSEIKALEAMKHVPEEWRIIYRVRQAHKKGEEKSKANRVFEYYLDQPRWFGGIEGQKPLAGSEPITNIMSYLERHSELAFVVFRDYGDDRADGPHFSNMAEAPLRSAEAGYPLPCAEAITFVYPELKRAVEKFLRSQSQNHGVLFPSEKSLLEEMQAPYLALYHHRERLQAEAKSLPKHIQGPWRLFLNYVERGMGPEYSQVDRQFQQGFVCPRFLKYLIKPGDILHFPSHGTVEAVQAMSFLDEAQLVNGKSHFLSPTNETEPGAEVVLTERQQRTHSLLQWSVDVAFWSFNNSFKHESKIQKLSMSGELDELVSINSLSMYPIQWAREDVKKRILERGFSFWKCRIKRYVEYSKDEGAQAWSSSKSRYMIDPETYRRMHGATKSDKPESTSGDLTAEQFQNDACPPYPFPMLLPKLVSGYNFSDKRWVDLEVEYVRDVEWNIQAFENLVVTEDKTKDLLEALVKNQLQLETATDLIAGKGNGLIILLHGGPGTGKTYTAESVADYARKPLFRVTCGDIGTKPVDVEKYLETVLRLGRIWGCVVLLDEADVFLEERTLSDLDRNALVSVFLRVLEYYNGIMILTSNRVGHFDEAFKSRIQLALHYESLTQTQRQSIWVNFIKHLHNSGGCEMDFADLQLHIEALSKEKMNGRQIRNAITTARQLADFKGLKLSYKIIKEVIDIAAKFDHYLQAVKQDQAVQDGTVDEHFAREAGIR